MNYCLERRGKRSALSYSMSFFAFLSVLVLAFYTGFRDFAIGIDTLAYSREYELASIGEPIPRGGEWLFTNLLVFFSGLGFDFRVFLVFHGFFYYVGLFFLSYSVNRNSGFVFVLLFFVFSGLFLFGLSGVRQTISIAILMYAFPYLIRGRFFVYVVLGLVSFFIHNSSFVPFVVLFVASYVSISNAVFVVLMLFTPVFSLFDNGFIGFFDFVDIKQLRGGYENEKDFLSYKVPLVFWILSIFVSFVIFFKRIGSREYRLDRTLKWASLMMLSLLWMAVSVRLFDRLAFYFMPLFGVLLACVFGGRWKYIHEWILSIGVFSFFSVSIVYINRNLFF